VDKSVSFVERCSSATQATPRTGKSLPRASPDLDGGPGALPSLLPGPGKESESSFHPLEIGPPRDNSCGTNVGYARERRTRDLYTNETASMKLPR